MIIITHAKPPPKFVVFMLDLDSILSSTAYYEIGFKARLLNGLYTWKDGFFRTYFVERVLLKENIL